ncbi:hypothetical protein ACIRBX_02820 [Kitasatospora sp. NPDC096147]|uniref:hypothetical protein n=1 Tax=Kitasatospora sp. NPDC096147 TaxID=3364093 RepID=UPI003815DDA1
MKKLRALSAAGGVALAIGFGGFAATPAAAASCTTWFDGATFGASCSAGGSQFQAYAKCGNASNYTFVYGDVKNVGSGQWSYAYCASVGRPLISGGVLFQ